MIRLLTKKSFKLLFQRARTKICEVDLIFERDGRILLLEVKTLASPFGAFERVGKKQQQRLKTNMVYLSRCYPLAEFQSFVVYVQADQSISFASLD